MSDKGGRFILWWAMAEIAERDAEIQRLKAALQPFAERWEAINDARKIANANGWDWPFPVGDDEKTRVSVGAVRLAADALKGANRDE